MNRSVPFSWLHSRKATVAKSELLTLQTLRSKDRKDVTDMGRLTSTLECSGVLLSWLSNAVRMLLLRGALDYGFSWEFSGELLRALQWLSVRMPGLWGIASLYGRTQYGMSILHRKDIGLIMALKDGEGVGSMSEKGSISDSSRAWFTQRWTRDGQVIENWRRLKEENCISQYDR